MHNVYVCIITEASRGVKEIRLFISSLLLFFCFFLLYNSIYIYTGPIRKLIQLYFKMVHFKCILDSQNMRECR